MDCSTKVRIRKSSVFWLLLAACGTGHPADSDPNDSDAATPADTPMADAGDETPAPYTAALPVGEWVGMSFAARAQFMREMVVPSMREAFAQFDPVRFEKLGCRSCHGQGAMDGTFAMPSADLPVLSTQALMNPREEDRAMLEFMRTVVRPKLSELLGAEDGGQTTVRCSTCHVTGP